MSICRLCCTKSEEISQELGVCLSCIRYQPEKALPIAMEAHRRSRQASGLPEKPPRAAHGIPCSVCVNECRIPEHGTGYCGLRRNEGGKLVGATRTLAKISWLYGPCRPGCPAGTFIRSDADGPMFGSCPGQGRGSANLAVFFHACSFNCLFCSNWEYEREMRQPALTPLEEIIAVLEDRSCVFYFGGDPTPQLPFALQATKLAKAKGRSPRVCWETSGSMHPSLLEEMVGLSREAGGCIKFDLKAWNSDLHRALTGVANRRTLANFRRAAEQPGGQPVPAFLVASTLLVPGYIDTEEVRNIARFIASVDPGIQYTLLGFFPQFYMADLPFTTRAHAERCAASAREEGLTNVRIGNVTLLT